MWKIYDELIASVSEELTVKDYMIGLHWTIIRSEKGMGLAKTVRGGKVGSELKNIMGMPLKQLASAVKSWNLLDASLGMAAINSVYNNSASVMAITDPSDCSSESYSQADFNVFTNHVFETNNKKVAVVGHFPKIEQLSSVCRLSILERDPQPGDYPDTACEYILPQQDLVFITGTAFINKTVPRLLELSKNAQVIMLGPSVPLSTVLFRHGVDVIAGMVVTDEALAWNTVQTGGNKIINELGGQRVCISR